ncbi:MAG: M48 family metalloprotease [Verrucomicrobiota bacterium]
MNTANGIYFDGQVTRGRAVAIAFGEDGIVRIAGEDLTQEIPLTAVRVSDRLGDVPRFIYLPNDAVIETPDNAVVDAALALRRQSRASLLIHALESRQRIAAAACILLVIGIVSLGFYGPPVLARIVAKRVPAEIDNRIGAAALATIGPYFEESSLDEHEQELVRAQLARLQGQPSIPPVRIEFRSTGGRPPNAFALPGNVLIVTDEIVRLPLSDDEMAAVLAHELGHLEQRHGLQGMLRKSFAVLIVAAITGDLSTLTSFASSIPLTLLTAGYSRDLEREADLYALELLRARGIPPRAFASVMIKLEASHGPKARNLDYLSTHPPAEERTALFGGLSPADRNALLTASAYEQAAAAVRSGAHATAVLHYGRVIELEPTAEAFTLRAKSHIAQKDSKAAAADLAKALELDPARVDAAVLRADVLVSRLGNYTDGILAAKQALELDPDSSTAAALLGYAEFKVGDATVARAALDRAISLDPLNYRGWAYRAHLKHRIDREGALSDYDEALKLDPKHEWIYLDRGILRTRLGDPKGALEDFAKVKDTSRHTAVFYFERGLAQHHLNQTSPALESYSRAIRAGLDKSLQAAVYANRGILYNRKNDHQAAASDFTTVLGLEPANWEARLGRATARRRLGEPGAALVDIEQAMQGGADEARALRERGHIRWALENYREALSDFDRLIELKAETSSYRARGLLYFCLADWSRAEANLNSVLAAGGRADGEYAELFRLLVRRRGKFDEEQAAFAATIAKWSDSWARTIGLYLIDEIDEVRLLAETNIGKTPPPNERRCEAYFYIGEKYLLAGDHARATDFFEKCIGTRVTAYFEYQLATAELKRLQGKN